MNELTRRFNQMAASAEVDTPELEETLSKAAGELYDQGGSDALGALEQMLVACVEEHGATLSLDLVKSLVVGLRSIYKSKWSALDDAPEPATAEPPDSLVPPQMAERIGRAESMLLIFAFQEQAHDWLRVNSIWCEKVGGARRPMADAVASFWFPTGAALVIMVINSPHDRRKLQGMVVNYVWCHGDLDHETRQRALARAVPKNNQE